MRHPGLKKLITYAHVLKIECDRFLRHACCPRHAIEVYRTWTGLRDGLLRPAIAGSDNPDAVEYAHLMHVINNVRTLADGIDKSQPGINGWLIEGLFVRHPHDWPTIMFALAGAPPVLPLAQQPAQRLSSPDTTPPPLPRFEVTGPKGVQ